MERRKDTDGLLFMIPVVLIDKNGLLVQLTMTKSDSIWKVKASFSNKSTAAMENMTLHLAAPKVTRERDGKEYTDLFFI
jgi:hypothetical protein